MNIEHSLDRVNQTYYISESGGTRLFSQLLTFIFTSHAAS